jgi:phosphoribosylamine--glycine ligase
MNILILGSGGREHALAWAVKQNPKCDRLIVAPGNAGIAAIAECADLNPEDSAAQKPRLPQGWQMICAPPVS